MEVSKIKQPEPNIIQEGTNPQKREINAPKVGVVDVPNISTTPMADTLTLKKQENPHIIYKLTNNNIFKGLKFHNILSIGIGACGIGALVSVIKTILKTKKVPK